MRDNTLLSYFADRMHVLLTPGLEILESFEIFCFVLGCFLSAAFSVGLHLLKATVVADKPWNATQSRLAPDACAICGVAVLVKAWSVNFEVSFFFLMLFCIRVSLRANV